MDSLPFARRVAAVVLALGIPLSLSPETAAPAYPGILDFPEPVTVQGDDDVFVTSGYILLAGDRARAESLIADVPRWRNWMLAGMDGPRDDGKRLLVYLLDLVWNAGGEGEVESSLPAGTLDVYAILPLLKSFGADPSVYRFDVRILRAPDGSLQSVRARFVGDSFALREAEYSIEIGEAPPAPEAGQTGPDAGPGVAAQTAVDAFAVRYRARVRIHGFLDFFFSLRAYRRTIGWYLDRIARNFAEAWNEAP